MNPLRWLTSLALLLLFAPFLSAQGIRYQAVARNASGLLMANETIQVRFSILQGSPTGTLSYRESHTATTNAYALFAVSIGQGSPEQGTFAGINWAAGAHFLNVEVNGSDMGTTQLETVPYSQVATAMRVDHLTDVAISAVAVDDVLKWNGSAWVNAADEVEDADADPTNELQTLSLSGNQLSLSQGGGAIALTPSPWIQSGSNIYYNNGNVGIGLTNPADVLEVTNNTSLGVVVSVEKQNAVAGNDVLEIRTQGGAPDDATFIEMQRGSTVEARIQASGAAEFLNVTVEEVLNATTAPVKGRVYANALPVAYGYVSSGITTASMITEFGVAGISKPASTTGTYVVTLDNTLVGQAVILGTAFNASPSDEIVTANQLTSTTVEFNITNGSGNSINTNFYFVIYGTVQ